MSRRMSTSGNRKAGCDETTFSSTRGMSSMSPEPRFSLETLVENENLGLEVLHPGGLEITRELAELCRIERNALVLDAASGTGESACYLAETRGARVVGVDISRAMLARAKAKAVKGGLHIEFGRGDAERLPFRGDVFDAVVSECTICLLDKEPAMEEMVRVAKPGGYVGIHDMCWIPGAPEGIKRRLAELEGERPETLEGWKTLFETAGLVDIRTVDKSELIPTWIRDIRKRLGIRRELSIFLRILTRWGIRGLRNALESERVFQSRFTGYGIVVGRKPS